MFLTRFLPSFGLVLQGPDGTKGFVWAVPRGKALEGGGSDGGSDGEGTAPGSSPYALFAGLPLKGIGPQMVRSLSIAAQIFVPRTASTVSLGSLSSAGGAAS